MWIEKCERFLVWKEGEGRESWQRQKSIGVCTYVIQMIVSAHEEKVEEGRKEEKETGL